MIWQGPREGKMKQIPRCDYPSGHDGAILPARDCTFSSRNKISLESKWTHESFLSQNNFRESKRILCDFFIFAFLWTSTSSRSIKTLIENLANLTSRLFNNVQGVSKVRKHFKKSILHPDVFFFSPLSCRH